MGEKETWKDLNELSKKVLKAKLKETALYVVKWSAAIWSITFAALGAILILAGLMPFEAFLIIMLSAAMFSIDIKYIFPMHEEAKQRFKELDKIFKESI